MIHYWEYFKQIFLQWAGIFLGTLTTIITIQVLTPIKELDVYLSIGIIALSLIISVVITLIIYPPKNYVNQIGEDEIWLLERNSGKPTIRFPYQNSFLIPVNRLAKQYYGKNYLEASIVKPWYEKNPFSIVTLTDVNHRFVGYFDVLPLHDQFADSFINGLVKERDIKSQNVFSNSEMRNAKTIYFAGIAVKNETTTTGKFHGAMLLYAALLYLEEHFDLTKNKKIIAIAATDCGRKILEKLGFKIEVYGTSRKDKCDLYSRDLDKVAINKWKSVLSFLKTRFDYSELVK